jgi:SPP1 gp7 family putative phage head morphogenesis protein
MDAGKTYTQKKINKLTKNIEDVYAEAYQDISKKMDEFTSKFVTKNTIYTKKLQDGEITQEQYDSWLKGQVFQSDQWKLKKAQITKTIMKSNQIAAKIISGESHDVFAFNANYTSYGLEHGAGINFGLGIYDEATVVKLIKDDPKLLPEWKIDEKKDYIWNQKKLNNAVTQGIIQGESLDKISDRISKNLSMQNKNSSMTFARTAMTGAQNAGRSQSLIDAKAKGIKLIQQWMATFDARTRDTHAAMDGETIKVGDKWHPQKFSNGCRYPGDPDGPPHEVYNCRCTLVGDLEDYPEEFERYDNIDGKPVKDMTYKEWYKAKYGKDFQPSKTPQQSAASAKKAKAKTKKLSEEEQQKKDYEDAKKKLDEIEQEIKDKGADKKFEGIWYGKSVSYADWEQKKDSISAKKEYYEEHISKYKKEFYDDIAPDEEAGEELWNALSKHSGHKLQAFEDSKVKEIMESLDMDEDDFDNMWMIYVNAEAKVKGMTDKLELLEEFEKHGEEYSKLLTEKTKAQKFANSLKPKPDYSKTFDKDAYTQGRKDAAIWAQSSKEADNAFRANAGEVWRNATHGEKRAAFEYTAGSGKFNRPTRGYDGSWSNPVGIGNVALDREHAEGMINDLTNLLEKSHMQNDTWLQRGIESISGLSNFVGIPTETLRNASQEELEQLLLGKTISDAGFMSCGSAKGKGFSGSILNIYCPAGTQALYCEPFSAFSGGHYGINWDGIQTQSSFGGELETLLQRNSDFVITKVEKDSWGKIYLDIDLIGQDPHRYDDLYEKAKNR